MHYSLLQLPFSQEEGPCASGTTACTTCNGWILRTTAELGGLAGAVAPPQRCKIFLTTPVVWKPNVQLATQPTLQSLVDSPNKQRAASGRRRSGLQTRGRRRSQARRTVAAAQPGAGRRHGYWLALPAGR